MEVFEEVDLTLHDLALRAAQAERVKGNLFQKVVFNWL